MYESTRNLCDACRTIGCVGIGMGIGAEGTDLTVVRFSCMRVWVTGRLKCVVIRYLGSSAPVPFHEQI